MQQLNKDQLTTFQNNHFEVQGLLTLLDIYVRYHSKCKEDGIDMQDDDYVHPACMDSIMLRVKTLRHKNYDLVVEGI